jgi:protein-disulfide isomerase
MGAAADSGDSLGSAQPPPPGPGDHIRGEGPEAILYLDLACPRCAATWPRVSTLPLRLCVRHFPVASKRPRSPALHAAAEAAALHSEDSFWAFWDSLLADRSHVDDPHLWERARALGIDPSDFDRDRRSDGVAARVRRDFRSGIRAGVVSTPAAFAAGAALPGEVATALAELAGAGSA